MKQVYETSHFSLRRKIDEERKEDIEFIVLNPNGFDLVQKMGFGIDNPKSGGYDITPYIERLDIAKTESEKDKVLYELYFIITEIADNFC